MAQNTAQNFEHPVTHWFVHSKNQETGPNCCLAYLTVALECSVARNGWN